MEKRKNMNFSVLMSVYKNEEVEYFKAAMDSVLNQTLLPDEIVLVRDGVVPEELQNCINEYRNNYKLINYIPIENNLGLGRALAHGLQYTHNDIVARMDTDDISLPNRFEIQIGYLQSNPDIDVLGGQIIEFQESPENPSGKRYVPKKQDDILKYMKTRNPFNHMTVVFKKQKVMDAGSYKDMHYVEDYYLWCRMALNGCKFANVSETVVFARTGKDMFKRRGGYKYFKSWKKIENFKLENGISSRYLYVKTLIMRFTLQVLMPSSLRGAILNRFSRQCKN